METRVERGQRSEDRFTGAIERQTSQAPSSLFLGLALGSMAASAILKLSGKDDWALFVGQWAAPFQIDRKSTRLNSSHVAISYAVFCLKKKKKKNENTH